MSAMDDLFRAAGAGDAEAARTLLETDPSLAGATGPHQMTPLHVAAEKNHRAVAAVLLDAGADLEARTAWGATPLEWACMMGCGDVAELLLERGATGMTIVFAAAIGQFDAVHQFLSAGELEARGRPMTDAEREDTTGYPPDTAYMQGDVLSEAFHYACRYGHKQTANLLLERGAQLDAKGYFGATALQWAAINGHRATVDWLLGRGADRTVRDVRFNATPAEWADEGGHADLAARIRRP